MSPPRRKTRFGQLVIGPPGAGKSTYCYGLQQFFSALGRPCAVINLDPAVSATPYACDVNITDIVALDGVMNDLHLGPNGGMLYCMEYLEANFDLLEEAIDNVADDRYLVFDLPGQVELSTDHDSLRRISERLVKMELAAVHLTDAHHVSDASKYISVILLALRTMLQLELPHVNVLSKVDLIAQHGTLPFNLDFYTDVQDLSYLEELLDASGPRTQRWRALNHAICGIIEEFSLVGFQTLCVEDKQSMATLIKTIDKAIGYVDRPADTSQHHHSFDLRSLDTAATPLAQVQDVQERYIDRPDVFREHERQGWKLEGEIAAKRKEAANQH